MTLRLAVHLHIYYLDMWYEIKPYLKNLEGYAYDLYVTMNKQDDAIIKDIKDFNPSAKFFMVENRGYDVGPFVYFLHQINLNDYDLILKLHTKNNKNEGSVVINNKCINRKFWFLLLIESLIGSRAIFDNNIRAFEQDDKLGMIGSKYLISSGLKNAKSVEASVRQILERMGVPSDLPIVFVSGTMFMVRSHIMQKIKDSFNITDFEITSGKVHDETLAHVLERLFGCLTQALGYKIQGFDKNIRFELDGTLEYLKRFIYQKKVTKHNCLQIKIFRIPVYRKKMVGSI